MRRRQRGFRPALLSRRCLLAGLPAGAALMAGACAGIQTPDTSTVVLRFKEPFVPFLNYAGSYNNPIVAHEIFDQYGNFKDHIVGTGPFQLDEASVQKGSRWSWKKNQSYWDAGKPYVDEVRWLIVADKAYGIPVFRAAQYQFWQPSVHDYTPNAWSVTVPHTESWLDSS